MPRESLKLYGLMRAQFVRPDEFTLPFVVKACMELSEFETGRVVHSQGIKQGLEFFTEVRNELVLLYVKSGDLGLAECLFESMVERDLVAWNTFVAGCVQTGCASKALSLFHQMELAEMKPDAVTVVSLLSACGQLGCLEIGEGVYKSARAGSLESNTIVENARLDMYMKCGNTELARAVFDSMRSRNVISWSTMIHGYAINGKGEEALALFMRMRDDGTEPNHVTYLGVLSACVHAGHVSLGRIFFDCMTTKGVEPRREHYACMVDLLGRSGNLNEAHSFIMNMPTEPDGAIWGSLLGACAVHGNVEMGQIAADAVLELALDVASYQVLLSNMYAAAGKWDLVQKLRIKLRKKCVKKVAAYSSIELNGEIHVFYGGDKSHPRWTCIYETLEDLCLLTKSLGYVLKTNPLPERLSA